MLASCSMSHEEQDRFLVEMYARLNEFAGSYIREDRVEDLVHDIIADVLVDLRKATLSTPMSTDEAFVKHLLSRYVANGHRRRRTAESHDGEHLRVRELEHPSWMSHDPSDREEFILEVQARVLEKLPRRCRMAYQMVRNEGCTYQEAAKRIGVSHHTVCNYLVKAQRAFRDHPEVVDALGQAATRLNRETGAKWRAKDEKLEPRYPAPKQVSARRDGVEAAADALTAR
jgi:RNA polymerase sigma factor (sigma-70 family)